MGSRFSKTFRILSGTLALFIAVIFLVSKVPSSKCHCHDPVKSKKEVCPFGVLRTLTTVQTVAPPNLELPSLVNLAPPEYVTANFIEQLVPIRNSSRDPPNLG